MRILVKLMVLFFALIFALNVIGALLKFRLQPMVLSWIAAGCALAFGGTAAAAGVKQGSLEAAWHAGFDGAMTVLKALTKAGKFIVGLAISEIVGTVR